MPIMCKIDTESCNFWKKVLNFFPQRREVLVALPAPAEIVWYTLPLRKPLLCQLSVLNQHGLAPDSVPRRQGLSISTPIQMHMTATDRA